MVQNTIYKTFFLSLFVLTLGCSGEETSSPGPAPPPGIDPRKVLADLGPAQDYYQLAEDHSNSGEVILLTSQGGPVTDLGGQEFGFMHDFFSIAYVHQAQTLRDQEDGLDNRLLNGDELISIEKARRASMKSAAILHKVAAHFKAQGKTVYLMTHSFGSFIIPHTLTYYGNNFDKIFIGAGRIEIQQETYEAFLNGCGGRFTEDGMTFQEFPCEDIKREENLDTQGLQRLRSGSRLQGTLGENRYRRLLKNVRLDNILYVYGNSDKAVGRLSSEEVTFLRNKKAQVIALDNTGHELKELQFLEDPPDIRSLLADEFSNQVINFFTSPLPSSYELLEMPADGQMATYGQSESSADKYKIGIVFENHSARQVSYKLNSAFGEGPFSLFKTNVFKNHKSRFHIEFGQITQDEDQNAFNLTEDQKKEMGRLLVKTLQESQNQENLTVAVRDFSQRYSLDEPFYYFNILKLKELIEKENLTTREQNRKRELEYVRDRFTDFFHNSHNQNKNFDLVVYVSSGIAGGYANTQADTNIHSASKVIYMPSSEFFSVFIPGMGIHSDYFAVTLVHELGHILGNLVDEYYSYGVETSRTPVQNDLAIDKTFNRFRNNCFDWYQTSEFSSATLDSVTALISQIVQLTSSDGIEIYYPRGTEDVPSERILNFTFDLTGVLNPWTHETKVPFFEKRDHNAIEESGSIQNYDGKLYGGCNGGKSFRGTENSIMRIYHLYRAKDWPDAWGPINTYYLKRGLNLQ